MKKYIVYGQKFPFDDEDDLGSRFNTVKIGEYDNEEDADDCLASVRKSANYEYEWIEEVET